MNKRKSIRVPVNVPARFLFESDEFEAIALNLSEDGIFLKTDRLLNTNDPIQLHFRLPDIETAFDLKARVVWGTRIDEGTRRAVSGMGVQFEQIPELVKRELHEFIQRLLNR